MKKNILLSFSTLLLLLSIVLSCTDHFPPDPLPNHQRIKKITQTLPDEPGITYITNFSYTPQGDSLKQLQSYKVPDDPQGLYPVVTRYSFRSGGAVDVQRNFTSLFPGEFFGYLVNAEGKALQINYYNKQNDNYLMFFTYNGSQLESSRKTFKFSSVSFEQKIWYFFAGNNLSSVKYETTLVKNIPSVTNSESQFTYDDKVNPFYGMLVIPASNVGAATPTTGNFYQYTFAAGLDNFMHLSRNNVLSEKSSTLSETTYSYEYNADGLPTKRITMKKNTPQDQPYVAETIIIEYETY